MIIVDIIIIIFLILAAWQGFSKGIIMQIASLAALILGILASYFFWNEMYQILEKWLEIEPFVLKIISVVSMVAVVFLVIYLLGIFLSKVIKITIFGIFDRFLGLIFGVGQMTLLLSFIIFALLYINPGMEFLQDNFLARSYILPYIKPIASYVINYIF
ncbi:MAG: CvpA family protein [Bacteroidales bacterium]|jgi:membrane protein required for colicin V production|nr:CvpA family protein [Bacteroidales bacterium]